MDLSNLTITKARELLDSGKITSVQLTQYYLDNIKKKNEELFAFVTICEDVALGQAKKADGRIKNGEKGILLGIPYAVKDTFCTKGIRTTASSFMLEHFIAPYNCTVVQRLEDAGAVLLGKNNLDAWGYGSSTENSDLGITRNPYDLSKVAGGSSGGSAAAVAADLCVFALGGDTGGSIRQPAALCGVYGLKVTYGKVSRYGTVALASSLDTIGPLTRSAKDLDLILDVIKGTDNYDATLENNETKEDVVTKINTNPAEKPLAGVKFALPKEYIIDGMDEEVKKVFFDYVEQVKSLGGIVEEVSIPSTQFSIPIYYIVNMAETSTNMARYDGIRYGEYVETNEGWQENVIATRSKNIGAEGKRRIMIGTYVLSSGYYDAYYLKAQKVRTKLINEFDAVYANYDAILSPVTPSVAFGIGENTSDPIKMYLEDVFTVTANIVGVPALSIPYAKNTAGLPIGVQLLGQKWSEKMINAIAQKLSDHKI